MELILSPRLEAVASLVRKGAVLSDVGTDHALLPAYLLLEGRVKSAIASDIVKGPLLRAEETIKKYRLSPKIKTVLTPGLCGIEAYVPTDIVIAGMGGQTIAEILEAAPFVKDPEIRLILQPMTKSEILRDYLAKEGFEILCERRVMEDHRIYAILCCQYSGIPYSLSPLEKLFGKAPQEQDAAVYQALLSKKEEQLKTVIKAKEQNSLSAAEESLLLAEIEKALSK